MGGAKMYIAMAVVLYLGFALLVGRFCSMNSRWEKAVSHLMDAESADVALAEVSMPAPSFVPPSSKPRRAAQPSVREPRESIRMPEDAAKPVEVG
jgi:hypothetical protein